MRDLDIKRIELESQLVPRMPPGLPELMEGLTKAVLLHNPENVYEFCAEHMKTLLKLRNENARRSLTLDEKIKIAQRKVRANLKKRAQEYDAMISNFHQLEQHNANSDPGNMNKNELMTKILEPEKLLFEGQLESGEHSTNLDQKVVELNIVEDVAINDGKKITDCEIEQRIVGDQNIIKKDNNLSEVEGGEVDNCMRYVDKQNTASNIEGKSHVLATNNESSSIQDSNKTEPIEDIMDKSANIIDNLESSDLSEQEKSIIETICDSNSTDHIDVQKVIEVDILNVSNEITSLSKSTDPEIIENHKNIFENDSHDTLLDANPMHDKVSAVNSLSEATPIHKAQISDEIFADNNNKTDQNVVFDTNEVFASEIEGNIISGDDIHGGDSLKKENNNEPDTTAIHTSHPEDLNEITDSIEIKNLKHLNGTSNKDVTPQEIIEDVKKGDDKNPDASNQTDIIKIGGFEQEINEEHKDVCGSKKETLNLAKAAITIQQQFRIFLNRKQKSILVEAIKDVADNEKITNSMLPSEKHESLLESSKKGSMDLDTAASTLQKHFRSFRLRKNRFDSIDRQCPLKVNGDTESQKETENCNLKLSDNDLNIPEASEKETMDLETAAITIQKHFRTFMFKNKSSLSEEHVQKSVSEDGDDETDLEKFAVKDNETRKLGLMRMDTILQTVNEEKSLSLSTDDSSTLSSAATIIQARVRGFLARNKLNAIKLSSSDSKHSDDLAYKSLETVEDRPKTILNIQLIQDMDLSFNRDESIGASLDLPMDDSPPPMNLHPLGYDRNEPGKRLKRENAIQSVSPPSNNSGKQSEETDSAKEIFVSSELLPKLSTENIDKNEGTNELTQDITIQNDTMCSKASEDISDSQNKLMLENESDISGVASSHGSEEKNDVVGDEDNLYDCKVNDDESKLDMKSCSEKLILNEKLLATSCLNIESTTNGTMAEQVSEDKIETSLFNTPKVDSAEYPSKNEPSSRQTASKQNFDTVDVVTTDTNLTEKGRSNLIHSSEFHDVLLPTRIIRNDSPVLRGE